MNYERIFLVGFMCSGKTTVGNLLAKELGWEFIDLDKQIEHIEGMTIPQIFRLMGEQYFRRREMEVLTDIIRKKNLVISTGGGLGANQQALEIMKNSGLVVWLSIDFKTFLERCGEDLSRPLIKKGRDELLNLLQEREKYYMHAHVRLDGKLEPQRLVMDILQACKNTSFTL